MRSLKNAEHQQQHAVHLDQGHGAEEGQIRHKRKVAGIPQAAYQQRIRPRQGGESACILHEKHEEAPSDKKGRHWQQCGLVPCRKGERGDGSRAGEHEQEGYRIPRARKDKEGVRN